jgi:hypothetical protein
VSLNTTEHSLVLRDGIVTKEEQHDLDRLGIAKYARDEKIQARNEKMRKEGENDARMAKLYREVVLKEKPAEPLVQLVGLNGNGNGHNGTNGKVRETEHEEVFTD